MSVLGLWSFLPPLTVLTFLMPHIILRPQIPPTGHDSQTCIGCADLPPNSWLTYPTAFSTSFPLKYFIDTWNLACLNYDVSCITTVHCIQPSSSKMKALSPLWPKSFMSFLRGHFFTEASPQNLKLQPHFRSIFLFYFFLFPPYKVHHPLTYNVILIYLTIKLIIFLPSTKVKVFVR